ncbi:MAG: ribosome small subunit-dependent GTPase A [Woeseiaceae bacterium]|nr:ribosome small subunit-dependent GTPase A [Woeseiaceae bacterium]
MPADAPIVIATYSRRMRLALPDGQEVDARIRGKRLRPVCGDRVEAEPIPGETDWLITGIAERGNALTRPDSRGRTEVLAANVDLLVAVAALLPRPDWFVIDRYLAAAENMHADAAVVLNKVDLDADGRGAARAVLEAYAAIGYRVLEVSAVTGAGCDALSKLVAGRTAIVAGQSGVGKSSLINRLLGEPVQRTGAIAAKRDGGRHTTVNSVMRPLPQGGAIIDSPGVRDYAPALASAVEVGHGFREIEARRAECRFANCRHRSEPGCAVRDAVAEGAISERRYESYRRLYNLTERLAAR